MKRFLFLDIDGVLNSDNYYSIYNFQEILKDLRDKYLELPIEMIYELSDLDKSLINKLNKIFEKVSDCTLIISSNWRFSKYLSKTFNIAGINHTIDGITNLSTKFPIRGNEIKDFLEKETQPYTYCILDDNYDFLPEQKNNVVLTNYKLGITDEDVDKVIKILNKC